MATFSKQLLSGSTNGKGVVVTTTASPGDTVHTAGSGTSILDEIWLWAVNNDSSDILLTIQYGGTAADEDIQVTIPARSGLVPVCAGLLLQNSLVVQAFAGTANKICLYGYVNHIA